MKKDIKIEMPKEDKRVFDIISNEVKPSDIYQQKYIEKYRNQCYHNIDYKILEIP